MVTLVLAIHNHQPVGNLDEVFQRAFQRCYAPVLEVFGRHPAVHTGFHYSGPLLEWIEAHEPGHLRDLERLRASGQVEILGGGFYEPLLAAIPPRDARGQVEMMGDYWQARSGVRPNGFWLTERIWEPSLPVTVAGTGLAYTLVDDTHLRHAGLQTRRFSGYYLTEKAGETLALFPIDRQLRYTIPFALPEQAVESIAAEADGTALTYGDDGEKFGLWPHTYEWVIEQGWLERFLSALEGAADRVRSATPGEYLAAHPPSGRVYLPTASYEEMMEWSLPAEAIAPYRALRHALQERGELDRYGGFVRGGTWDSFLVKYPESNQMHKRMLLVSERLLAAETAGTPASALRSARRALYQAQCNCAYWHGLFGGLYVNYLRHAAYTHLVRADRLLDSAVGCPAGVRRIDYDRDGHHELVATTADVVAIIKPDSGGALVELDWKPADTNVLDTLARRREGYHDQLLQDSDPDHTPPAEGSGISSIHDLQRDVSPDTRRALVFDRHPRHSFVDHLWRPDTTLERVERAEATDLVDLPHAPYEVAGSSDGPGWTSRLAWRGTVDDAPVTLTKTFAASSDGGGVAVTYTLAHEAPGAVELWFAVECNIALLAGDAPDRYFEFSAPDGSPTENADTSDRRLASRGAVGPLGAVSLVDDYARLRVRLATSFPFDLWRFPVETVSQSESGYQRTYQQSALYCHWRVRLTSGRPLAVQLTLTCSRP